MSDGQIIITQIYKCKLVIYNCKFTQRNGQREYLSFDVMTNLNARNVHAHGFMEAQRMVYPIA